jgi:hypothetical protein
MSSVAALLLYGNAAVALQPPAVRTGRFHLPCPMFLLDAFLMTGMFNSYSLVNTDLFIIGARTRTGKLVDRGLWIELALREHFVQRQGLVFVQLFSAHEWDMHGLSAQRRSWALLARRIREHHNHLHPERTVSHVAFGSLEWPQSPAGYRALKRAPVVHPRPWFSEAAKP